MEYETKDSGERVLFESGFTRDCADSKPRYDLIPLELLQRLAELYTRGAEKYDRQSTPICVDNVHGIIGSICKQRNVPEWQPVTQKKDTQQKECVLNVTPNNIQKQNELYVILIEFSTPEECVEYVMTEFLNRKIQNTTKASEKITSSGVLKILKECKSISLITQENLAQKLEKTLEKEKGYCLDLVLPGKTNIIYNKYKGTYVLYAEKNQAEYSLISTTTTLQIMLEDCYVENVIKDLDCLVTISKELKKLSNISNIHQFVKLNYEEKRFYLIPGLINNWQLATGEKEIHRFKECAWRHFVKWQAGLEDGEDHAVAAIWNVIAYEWHTKHKE